MTTIAAQTLISLACPSPSPSRGHVEIRVDASSGTSADDLPTTASSIATIIVENERGWSVEVRTLVLIVAQVSLLSCDRRTEIDVPLVHGIYSANFRTLRREHGMGHSFVKGLPELELCWLRVEHRPTTDEDYEFDETTHILHHSPLLRGNTLASSFHATKDGHDPISFEYASDVARTLEYELGDGDGILIDGEGNWITKLILVTDVPKVLNEIDFGADYERVAHAVESNMFDSMDVVVAEVPAEDHSDASRP